MDITKVLPSDCISKIISLTSPKDACGWCCVSYAFKEAADSDIAWESFLPSDYRHIISQSSSPNRTSLSAKQIYFLLHHHFILLANDTLSFSLTKEEDKRCYIMGAKALSIYGSDNPLHWNWTSIPTSRFPQVAVLNSGELLKVKGSFKTKLLSPKTIYHVYFIFKFAMEEDGLTDRFLKHSIRDERGVRTSSGELFVDHGLFFFIMPRENEWMELFMGDFCVFDEDEDGLMECRVWETSRNPKRGLVVEGFELRPTTKKWDQYTMCKRHRFSCH